MTIKVCYYESDKNGFRTLFHDSVYRAVGPITGSYNVLLARLFGVSYVDFFKILMKDYHADVRGKDSKYLAFSFKNEDDVKCFCNEVNKRWNYAMRNYKEE